MWPCSHAARKEQCQFCILSTSETQLPLAYLFSATLLKATSVWNLDHSKSPEHLQPPVQPPSSMSAQNTFLKRRM